MLFNRWALPGQEASDERPFRLAVRGGYLNFYAKGQSVAKLSLVRNAPRLEVHEAYVTCRVRGSHRENTPAGKDYRRYDAEALADPAMATLVSGWIETALTHATTEKRFVDDLVAANPG